MRDPLRVFGSPGFGAIGRADQDRSGKAIRERDDRRRGASASAGLACDVFAVRVDAEFFFELIKNRHHVADRVHQFWKDFRAAPATVRRRLGGDDETGMLSLLFGLDPEHRPGCADLPDVVRSLPGFAMQENHDRILA